MAVIYNIYIFDRHCQCVFYTEWARSHSPLTANNTEASSRPLVWPTDSSTNTAMEEEAKLVYGVVFSTRNIINKLSGKDTPRGGNPGGFVSFATNTYRLHYYEAPSGVKIVLNTDTATMNMLPALEFIYRNIYVEYVVKNPLFSIDPSVSTPIENDYFRAVLNNYVRELASTSGA